MPVQMPVKYGVVPRARAPWRVGFPAYTLLTYETVHRGRSATSMALVAIPLLMVAPTAFVAIASGAPDARARRMSTPLMVGKLLRSFGAADFQSEWPYTDADLERMDESPDFYFYTQPRFVTHIDDGAIASLTTYYREALSEGDDVLDLCSSWVSHLPRELTLGRVVGVGMNACEAENLKPLLPTLLMPSHSPARPTSGRRQSRATEWHGFGSRPGRRELEANDRLTDFVQCDLNREPKLPFDDCSFDVVLNVSRRRVLELDSARPVPHERERTSAARPLARRPSPSCCRVGCLRGLSHPPEGDL